MNYDFYELILNILSLIIALIPLICKPNKSRDLIHVSNNTFKVNLFVQNIYESASCSKLSGLFIDKYFTWFMYGFSFILLILMYVYKSFRWQFIFPIFILFIIFIVSIFVYKSTCKNPIYYLVFIIDSFIVLNIVNMFLKEKIMLTSLLPNANTPSLTIIIFFVLLVYMIISSNIAFYYSTRNINIFKFILAISFHLFSLCIIHDWIEPFFKWLQEKLPCFIEVLLS